MNKLAKFSLEALVVGIIVVVAGSLVSFLVGLCIDKILVIYEKFSRIVCEDPP